MTTTRNKVIFGLQHENCYFLTFGGENKDLVEGCTGMEMIRFLKRIVQKPTQVNIPNLVNS